MRTARSAPDVPRPLGYNRAKVDGPLMNATAPGMAWTYPLCDWRCYPVEPVSDISGHLAGVAAS